MNNEEQKLNEYIKLLQQGWSDYEARAQIYESET